MNILITGAAGFLGLEMVRAAVARGHHVQALVRTKTGKNRIEQLNLPNVSVLQLDLAASGAVELLAHALEAVDAVLHCAGRLAGSDAQHLTDTVTPLQNVISAMQRAGKSRIVHISSLSIYGYSTLPEGAQLDETTSLEHFLGQRDAYCRAKYEQEKCLTVAAQTNRFRVTVLRPGALVGEGRWWTSRIGVAAGSVAFVVGGQATLPLCNAVHCATASVTAAERDVVDSDIFIPAEHAEAAAGLEVINVLNEELPTQIEYLRDLQATGRKSIRWVFVIPKKPLGLLAKVIWTALSLAGASGARVPRLFMGPSFDARFKQLRYATCRMQDRLMGS